MKRVLAGVAIGIIVADIANKLIGGYRAYLHARHVDKFVTALAAGYAEREDPEEGPKGEKEAGDPPEDKPNEESNPNKEGDNE